MFNFPILSRVQGEAGKRIQRRRPLRSPRKKTSRTPVKVRVFTLNQLILPGLLFAIYLFSYQFFFSVSLSTYSIYRINILILRYFGQAIKIFTYILHTLLYALFKTLLISIKIRERIDFYIAFKVQVILLRIKTKVRNIISLLIYFMISILDTTITPIIQHVLEFF